ncbi:MAG: inner membrane CreD family protein, partial [Hyphomicrobiaceae bacterium]
MTFTEQVFSAAPRPGVKAIVVGFLTIAMSLAVLLVTLPIEDRRKRVVDVRREVGQAWGGSVQLVAGPFLVVPVGVRMRRQADDHETITVERGTEVLVFLAARTEIAAKLATERRVRGIFGVTVYKSDIAVTGRFDAPDAARYLK